MSWNYRVLAHKYEEEIYFEIHEVYYDENGILNGYKEKPVTISGENIKGMRWALNKMKECLKKPILWAGDDFPKEYL
jgi:hypothetical protein